MCFITCQDKKAQDKEVKHAHVWKFRYFLSYFLLSSLLFPTLAEERKDLGRTTGNAFSLNGGNWFENELDFIE